MAACLVVLAAAAACGEAPEAPPGSRARAASGKPRVASLVPAVTEMLFAIGAGPQVIGVGSFDSWPPEVRALPRLGALLDPDVERILRLRPDVLVLHVSQQELRDQMERVGIRTFAHATGGLADVTTAMREVGAMVGRGPEAESAASSFEARLAAIREGAAGRPRPRTLIVFGHEPGALRAIDASGGVGFLHDVVTLAGGDNVFAPERREAVRVTTEAILAAAPEVILDLRYGRESLAEEEKARERAAWDALPAVPAVRSGRVHVLVGDRFVIPGPRLVDAARDIAAALTPPSPPSTPRTTPAESPRASPR